MLTKNIINHEKINQIQGVAFHIFYLDLSTAVLFDRDLFCPIIYGNKNIVIDKLKKIDEYLKLPNTTKIWIYSYIPSAEGYRRVHTYAGPINTIGKYIFHY